MAATVALVDTHCHLNFEAFKHDRADVIERAAEAGVEQLILPATDLADSAVIARSVGQFGLYGAVGVHPNSTAQFERAWLEPLAELARQRGVVAIGEIGLDYHWDDSPKAKQFEAFEAQLDLAAHLALPVIIHNREASVDTLAVLKNWVSGVPRNLRERLGVLHSVSMPLELALAAVELGFYLGFTGPVTYKKADETRRIAAAMPLDRMLVETDAPFLPPVPHRGQRNEPVYIPLIVERIAQTRQLTFEVVAQATTANARQLFRLDA